MRVALAYSGGLDTTVSIKWLQEKYGAEVITVTVDVGQPEDFEEVERRAYTAGAVKHYLIDGKARFAEEFVSKAIKANALYEGEYPVSTALARYLIAEEVAKVAKAEGCDAVAHGCTGKGNDQLRFDATFAVLVPEMRVIAPVREWGMSRDEEVEYARSKGLRLDLKKSRFSIDENLWGRSLEAGELEDPWNEPPWDALKFVRPPSEWRDGEDLVVEFEGGVPVAVDGERMRLDAMVQHLNFRAGRHGVGLIDHIEDRVVGLKSREVYEAPAATVLIRAHRDLEKLVLSRRALAFKRQVEEEWAWLVYAGLWYDPLREALDAFVEETQKAVAGEVRLRLEKGALLVRGRRSPYSAYAEDLITYSAASRFDQRAGEAFSRIWSLESQIVNRARGRFRSGR
ncbi:MAG: argininosuccinate synthase [Thaumarchaeota archaeon]|nr:argininosuccinate synthase [Candidatus Calditenuaceae archaeon]MCX8203668.1 argininosuccinate synthase [Nitrososphaeria archaeon]MDW8043558.1 argininosuccinate synthase [Nitrososphaerota archaeon]